MFFLLPLMPRLTDVLQHAIAFERVVVTPYTFAAIFLPAFFSYYAMAVLVQLPHTKFHRAALLPVVFWLAIRANMSLDFSGNNPGRTYLNQALALGMFTVAMRSTAWVFAERSYSRLPIGKMENGKSNGHNGHTSIDLSVPVSSAPWNAWDLTVNLRGIGWNWPQRMHVPTPYFRVESRLVFVLLSLCQLGIHVVAFDMLSRYVCSLGPDTFGTPRGGTIFDPSLPLMQRYMKSSIITMLSGISAYTSVEVTYQVHAILFTILFQQYPSQWPPLFDSPWLSTSLASFWGRRWHQLFREYFVAIGSKPMERYLGRAGVVMGAFAVSGVLHDVGMQGMGRGADSIAVVGFFIMHGVGILMESAWKRATGKRVGGIVGRLWVFFWFALWGQAVVDVWGRRGLIGSEFWSEAYRPSTWFLNRISRENGAF